MDETLLIILILTFYFSPLLYHFIKVLREYNSGNKNAFLKLLKVVKFTVFSLLFVTIVVAVISHTNFFNYEKPIGYEKINDITFENFRGIELFKKTLYGSKRFAYVVTSIESDLDSDSVLVAAYFHPARSFVFNSHFNNEELLTHEIYHFKITELHSRIAKKRISELKNSNNDNIKKIIREVEGEEVEFQKKYDYDTFHSYVYKEQKRYQREIDSLLFLLNLFEKPKVKINEQN